MAVVAVLAAFVYATAYTALDVINGIGAGFVTWRAGRRRRRGPDEVRSLFAIGSPLGEVGSWALVVVAVVASAGRRSSRHGVARPAGRWS